MKEWLEISQTAYDKCSVTCQWKKDYSKMLLKVLDTSLEKNNKTEWYTQCKVILILSF